MLKVLSHFRLEEPPLVRPVLSPNRDQLAKGELNSSLPSPIRAYIHLAVRRLVTKSYEIYIEICPVVLKFDGLLGNSAVETHVEF